MVGMLTAYTGASVQRPIILLATTPLPRVAPITMRHATSVTAAETKTIAFDQASSSAGVPIPQFLDLALSLLVYPLGQKANIYST